MIKTKTPFTLLCLTLSIFSFAQISEIELTPDGVVFPRMNTTQRNSLNPTQGQCIFNTQIKTLECFDGSEWTTGRSSIIIDTDGDTALELEQNADEDIIRFRTNGTEIMRLDDKTLHFSNNGQSVFIGENAGVADDLSNNRNTFVGSLAGQANTTGTQNVAVGHQAMKDNIAGNNNVALGQQALQKNKNSNNIALGFNAARDNNNGNKNIAIGGFSGFTNQNGNQNTFLGYEAGRNTSTASSGNVMIGHQAGMNETGNNKLFIANDNTTAPLIYGEFDNQKLVTNGDHEINGDAAVNGSIKVNDPSQTGYQLPTADGDADQVLKTNGNGNVSWSNDVSGGGGSGTTNVNCTDPENHDALLSAVILYYMVIDGIDGGSNFEAHQDAIEVYGYELKQLRTSSGVCNNITFKIRKALDKASPKLIQNNFIGTVISEAELFSYTPNTNNGYKLVSSIKIEDFLIQSVDMETVFEGNGEYKLYEIVQFDIQGTIETAYQLYNPTTGNPAGQVLSGWDCDTNVPIN